MEKDKLLFGKIASQLYQFWLYLHFFSSRMGMRITIFIWQTLDLSVKKPKRLWTKWVYKAELTNTVKVLRNLESQKLLRGKSLELWDSPPFNQCGTVSWNSHMAHSNFIGKLLQTPVKKMCLFTKFLLKFAGEIHFFNCVMFIVFDRSGKCYKLTFVVDIYTH